MEIDMGYDFETAGFCNFNPAEFYGVKPGESDFSGAIQRALENVSKNGIQHLGKEFVEMLKDFLHGIQQR